MNLPLTTRLATADDLQPLTALFDRYRQFYECASDTNAAYRWLETNIRQNRSVIFVALADNNMLGFTQLYPALCSVDLVEYFVLYDLFVAEDARQKGVGRSLMTAASTWATQQGAARLDLETAKDNDPGQALYRSLGYAVDEIFLKLSLDLTR
jgi:ribosomal protein S18 acetylase RimI-like enzyme